MPSDSGRPVPDTSDSDRAHAPRGMRAYHWLAALPITVLLAGLPFANRVEPYVFGFPFLVAWIVVWVVATSVAMGIVYALDHRRGRGGP